MFVVTGWTDCLARFVQAAAVDRERRFDENDLESSPDLRQVEEAANV